MRKILILGGSSFVGRHLFARLGAARATATYASHPLPGGVRFDAVTMPLSAVVRHPRAFSHAILLLGDTKPDSCVADPARSQALNVDAIQRVIAQLIAWDITPIFTSSEFVFDGARGRYVETDPVSPILLYGYQKAAVERFLQDSTDRWVVARLAKVYGLERGDGSLLMAWMDAIERGQETIRCAANQIFSPVYVGDVVEALIRLVDTDAQGLFHVAGPEGLPRIAMLERLLDEARRHLDVKTRAVPCSIHDFSLPERRPLDVSMVPEKVVQATGIHLTPVAAACEQIAAHAGQTV